MCGDTSACDTYAYLQAVNAAGWCGYKDWRLPTMPEMLSIINFGRQGVYDLSIDKAFFPNTQQSSYWTATPAAYANDRVWSILSYSGDDDRNWKWQSLSVRLVRGK
ncbi:DUF1566 domain-containing protein [Methylocucumis oryzae]|uniref:Lcl C-terminal domain-containing protein n=1 Tax=Methylocucumis oryzae TaxID=1632867 RepID=UPI0009E28D54